MITNLNFAQKVILEAGEMHELDTIIYLNSICRNDPNLRGFTFCKQLNNDILMNYYNEEIHGDTFRIIKLKYPSYSVDSIDLIIKKGKEEFIKGIMSFDVVDSKIVILLSNKLLITEILSNSNYIKKFKTLNFLDGEVYQSVGFTNKNTILLSRSYNYKRQNNNFKKTSLTLVDINSLKIIKTINPNVAIIELSHMKPYSNISSTYNKVLIGQNNKYKFEIFDSALNFQYELNFPEKFKNKKVFDTSEIEKINLISGRNPTTIIQYLQPKFHSGIAFVDGYFFQNDSTIIIRYTLGENLKETFSRIFDIVKFNSLNNSYIFSDTSYLIKSPSNYYKIMKFDSIVNHDNFYIDFWLNQTLFSEFNTFVFSKGTNQYPIGLKRSEIYEKEINFYKNNSAIFQVTVLKNKF